MAETREKPDRLSPREFAIHALVLLIPLFFLCPAVFMRGESILPAALLFDTPPWSSHVPDDVRPFNNPPSIEAFILFNKYYSLTKQSLAAGEWPLWNPLEFTGIPLLANYQSATVYPLRILHALFPIPLATTIFILLKLWCCGMTAYACGRVLDLRRPAATFASLAWMLSGYHLAWVYHAIPDISAWLPLLLLAAELLARGQLRRGSLLLTIAATLLLLAGHPESAFTGALSVGIYFFIRLYQLRSRNTVKSALLCASTSWAVALCVGAVQIIPFLEYLPQSHTYLHRADDPSEQHFLRPGLFPIFWVPRYFGAQSDGAFWADGVNVSSFTLMAYCGIPTFLGLVLALFCKPEAESRRKIIALAVPAALSLMLAFRVSLLEPFFALPPFNSTWGSWYLTFPMLALCLLGATGLNHWFSKPRFNRALWPVVAIALVVGGAILSRFYLDRKLLALQGHETYVLKQLAVAGLLCLLSLVLISMHAYPRARRAIWPLLCALLAIDLLWASRGIVGTSPASHVLFPTPLTQHLQAMPADTRVNAASAGIMAGLLQPFGIDEIHAYDGILPARMWTFFGEISGETRSRLETLAGASHYLHDPSLTPTFDAADSERFKLLGTIDGVEIYEDTRAFPRAFLVDAVEPCATQQELFAQLRDPAFNPRTTALVEGEALLPDPQTSLPPGEAHITSRTFTHVSVSLNATKDALLVVNDAYYPNWKASIDGETAAILPAYHAFRGVLVPAGQHTVEFHYFPASFQWGLGISCMTLVAGSLYSLFQLRARTRRA